MAQAMTLCERGFLLKSLYTCTLCPMFSLHPSVVGLASPCTCFREHRIIRWCASHTCVTWSAKSLSFFHLCTSELSDRDLVLQVFCAWCRSCFCGCPQQSLGSNTHVGAAALSGLVICNFGKNWSMAWATKKFHCANIFFLKHCKLYHSIYHTLRLEHQLFAHACTIPFNTARRSSCRTP